MGNWFTTLIILLFYFGIAATVGVMLASNLHVLKRYAVLVTLFLLLPTSIGIPLPDLERVIFWGLSGVILIFFAISPHWLPNWIVSLRFLIVYFGSIMFLILIWSVTTGNPVFGVSFGIPALVAGILSMKKI
jgi:hypothetical protein